MEHVTLAELVENGPCIVVPGSPRRLVDHEGREIPPADYEKMSGVSPASFVTRTPVFGGFSEGGGIEYWVTNHYDERLELIRSEEPPGWS
jgi:hypothetical protein